MNNKNNIALCSTTLEPMHLSASETMTQMFEHTDEKGILYIPVWPDSNQENDKKRFYRLHLNWNEEQLASIIQEFEDLYNKIKQIVTYRITISYTAYQVLPRELLTVWRTYHLRETLVQKSASMNAPAGELVGQSDATYDVVLRVKRLYTFMYFSVPSCIIEREASLLAQTLVIYHYGKGETEYAF